MNIVDMMRIVDNKDNVRETLAPLLNLFKLSYSQVEISPYIKNPAILNTPSSAAYNLINNYGPSDSITTNDPPTQREFYFGDYTLCTLATYSANPISFTVDEHLYNSKQAAFHLSNIYSRIAIGATDTAYVPYIAFDRRLLLVLYRIQIIMRLRVGLVIL